MSKFMSKLGRFVCVMTAALGAGALISAIAALAVAPPVAIVIGTLAALYVATSEEAAL